MLWFEESTHSPAQYVTRQENCIFSFAELYWTKPFVVLCPSDLFSWYLFEELTMLGCYQLCPGNSSPGGTGWRRRTPLLTQCLESQNNIQTFLTNKSIFLTQRKTIFWWPYQHHDLWVCLVLASQLYLVVSSSNKTGRNNTASNKTCYITKPNFTGLVKCERIRTNTSNS